MARGCRRRVDAAAIIAVAAIAAAAGCGRSRHEPDAGARAAIDVTTATVASADLPEVYEAGGVVRARTTAAITSRLLAPVLEVRVAPGGSVRRGQVLVRLDDRDLTAQQRRAVADHEAAEQGGRAADAERDAARAALVLATAHHKRISLLRERNSATDDELDQAVAGLRAAEARLASAGARIAESAAALSAASASADAARVGASWAVITAPFDGVITEKLVEPGNMAAPGMPLLRMEQGGAMRVDVRLDESWAVRVNVGDAVDVRLDGGAGSAGTELPAVRKPEATEQRVTGRVAEIARAAEAGAHAFLVKIDLPPGVRAPSGTFARAHFSGPSRQVLVVPRLALVRHGQLTSVFVVDGDRARVRLVNTGGVEHGSAAASVLEILSGLDAGEHVVISPPPRLRDSARIHIVNGRVAGARDEEGS
ncbi:MAG TPA: efflux RND transporter periplasmic adaptor subunit [Vicinamibacterales bacterium]|nr:efflux RND transporter periplasmic adaptor subunit [Vicinamibacterales bacterium]